MTTGIRGDHLARLQAELKRSSDRIYELERRLGLKQTGLRPPAPTTVVAETSFGQAQKVGASRLWAKADHSHGTPAAPRTIMPSVAITHSANQSIPHNTDTLVAMNTTEYQTFAGMHDGSGVKALEKGIYAVWGSVKWADSTAEGFRSLHLEIDGGAVLQDVHHVIPATLNSRTSTQVISWQGKLAAGTVLKLMVVQQSGGGALNVLRGVQFSPYLGMTWLSDY